MDRCGHIGFLCWNDTTVTAPLDRHVVHSTHHSSLSPTASSSHLLSLNFLGNIEKIVILLLFSMLCKVFCTSQTFIVIPVINRCEHLHRWLCLKSCDSNLLPCLQHSLLVFPILSWSRGVIVEGEVKGLKPSGCPVLCRTAYPWAPGGPAPPTLSA